jgi:16S rRNA (guanine966-N2)-methyltransferase
VRALSSVRIIGGRWRGRKLPVLNEAGLRPTPDRVRETLFNWLMPTIQDTVVLDICAGTGVLGFEALSRGASKVLFIESNKKLCGAIREIREVLDAEAEVIQQNATDLGLVLTERKFDLVFLDPPYQSDLYFEVITQLVEGNYFAKNALMYIETSTNAVVNFVPESWQKIRSKTAGDVRYELFQIA